jgi:hypothetical protein
MCGDVLPVCCSGLDTSEIPETAIKRFDYNLTVLVNIIRDADRQDRINTVDLLLMPLNRKSTLLMLLQPYGGNSCV